MKREAATAVAPALRIEPITGAVGAEIAGVDLAGDLPDETIAAIRSALAEHGVIFFRGQDLTPERQKAFARRFGPIFIHPNFAATRPDLEIVEVVREPGDRRIVGEDWHTDTTMMASPPMGAVFYAVEVPPYGGDTLFASQYLAYDSLSSGMKAMLAGLKAIHSDRKVAGPAAVRDANEKRSTQLKDDGTWRETSHAHPVVCVHPESGRKYLFVNRSYTIRFENMTEEESRPLLEFLFEQGHRPEFTCRFRWQAGSVAFWDNRCTQHIAVHDAGSFRRVMRRVQVAGVPPQAALS